MTEKQGHELSTSFYIFFIHYLKSGANIETRLARFCFDAYNVLLSVCTLSSAIAPMEMIDIHGLKFRRENIYLLFEENLLLPPLFAFYNVDYENAFDSVQHATFPSGVIEY